MSLRTLAPSALRASEEPLRVGGRIAHGPGKTLRLVDAFGGAQLTWHSVTALSRAYHGGHDGDATPEDDGSSLLGALVLVEGSFDGHALEVTRVLSLEVPRVPKRHEHAASETQRFARVGSLLRGRAAIVRALRGWFESEGFLEVDTPSAVPNPGLDLHLSPYQVIPDEGGERWLATSPELHLKRLLVGGLPKVFEIARVHRRDERGPHHQPEFSLVEWYRAFEGAGALMNDTEALVRAAAVAVHGKPSMPTPGGGMFDLTAPWPRVRVDALFREATGQPLNEVWPNEDAFFRAWVDAVEPSLAERGAIFVTHWPAALASLARLLPDEPKFADRFEAYLFGVELCNGFGELTDPREQRARFAADLDARRARGLETPAMDERFLEALEEGMPSAGGNAMGLERLLMRVLGCEDIADVLAFPARR